MKEILKKNKGRRNISMVGILMVIVMGIFMGLAKSIITSKVTAKVATTFTTTRIHQKSSISAKKMTAP